MSFALPPWPLWLSMLDNTHSRSHGLAQLVELISRASSVPSWPHKEALPISSANFSDCAVLQASWQASWRMPSKHCLAARTAWTSPVAILWGCGRGAGMMGQWSSWGMDRCDQNHLT